MPASPISTARSRLRFWPCCWQQAFAAATEILTRRDPRPGSSAATALFATGTLAALALALTFALDKGWLTIALALTSAAAAWVSTQRPIPFLRVLSSILAGIVVLRIGYEPRIVGSAVGTTPIFNWLLWGYGVPALSFWMASMFLRRRGDDASLRSVEAAAILFTVLLVFLEIRHAVNGGDIYRASSGLTETALQVCAALAMAIGLERLLVRSGSIIHNVSAILLTLFAGAGGLVRAVVPGQSRHLAHRHRWRVHQRTSARLCDPRDPRAVFCLMRSRAGAMPPMATPSPPARWSSRLLCHLRNPKALSRSGTGQAARHLTSNSTPIRCVARARRAVARHRHPRQFAARPSRLGCRDCATIGKVFLVDLSTLTGVYRALSFMGLGLVLVAIGWFYQKVLFRRPLAPAASITPAGT